MAWVKAGRLLLPSQRIDFSSTPGTFQLNATADVGGWNVTAPKTGTITHVVFRVSAVTTSQTLRVRLVTADGATGDPTTTDYGGSTAGTQASPAAGTTYEVALGTSATATLGDRFMIRMEFDGTAGDVTINANGGSLIDRGYPYQTVNTSGTFGKSLNVSAFCLKYSDGSYPDCDMWLPSARTQQTWNSSSGTIDYGNHVASTLFGIRAFGMWAQVDNDTEVKLCLYDNAATPNLLASTPSLDPQERGGSTVQGLIRLPFIDGIEEIASGSALNMVIQPQNTTSLNTMKYAVDSGFGSLWDSVSMQPVTAACSRANSSAAFSTDALSRFPVGLIVDEIDIPAGGASGGVQFIGG